MLLQEVLSFNEAGEGVHEVWGKKYLEAGGGGVCGCVLAVT